MPKLKNNKGITLTALIITIIVMLLLAGIVIWQSTSNDGLFDKTKQSKLIYNKGRYIERINYCIYEEKIERYQIVKEEAFITSLKKRIEAECSDWVKEVITCDELSRTNVPDEEKTILIVITKEGYEIIVDVDNERENAQVRENSFEKSEKCTITYEANDGTQRSFTQEARKGLNVLVKENEYTREYYSFAGWSENSNGEGTRYVNGSSIRVDEDKTLYAIWNITIVDVSFDANTGDGEMNPVTVSKNSDMAFPVCTMTKEGYKFVAWNTKADGSGTNYEESKKNEKNIEIGEDDITLYAQWEIETYNITYDYDGGIDAGNPTSYTIETDTFTLTNPTRDGFEFTGWTGTDLDSETTAVTIEKGSTGIRSYTAQWKEEPIKYPSGKTAETVAVNDDITIGTEKFKVVKKTTTTITAIPYYNITITTDNPVQSSSAGTVKALGYSAAAQANYNSGHLALPYSRAYQNTLRNLGATNVTTRIPTQSELNSISASYRNPSRTGDYWTITWMGSGHGTTSTGGQGDRYDMVYYVKPNGSIDYTYMEAACGVRPIIEISVL